MIVQKRILLFFCGCIVLRSLFVYIAKTLESKYLPIVGAIALLISIRLAYLFIFGKSTIGAFGGPIWWNNFRLVHSIIYFIFAICAILKKRWSYIILILDVIIAITVFTIHYF